VSVVDAIWIYRHTKFTGIFKDVYFFSTLAIKDFLIIMLTPLQSILTVEYTVT